MSKAVDMYLYDMELKHAPPIDMQGIITSRTGIVGVYEYFINYRNKKIKVNQFAANSVAGHNGAFFKRVHGVWFATTSTVAYTTAMQENTDVQN